MTAPAVAGLPSAIGPGGDQYLRAKGRELLFGFYAALRAVQLYPPTNAVVQRALEDLVALCDALIAAESELELRVAGEFIFVNQTRLRLELDNYATFSRVIGAFHGAGIGACRVQERAGVREWTVFLAALQVQGTGSPDEQRSRFLSKLQGAGVGCFELLPPTGGQSDGQEEAKQTAKRTYAQSLAVSREVISSVRMGRSPNIKRVKRVVQSLVDQILNDETSLIGLTTLRDHDEYTFGHSVNVCIFSVALGRKLGFTRVQLYDLGTAALLHDLGKTRVPLEVLNKPGGLTDPEWRQIAAHPWLGVLTLFRLRGHMDVPLRAMVVAFEHHKKVDLTGYPKHVRNRAISLFSRIVSVADAFDAATSRRIYQTTPLTPAAVLQELGENPKRGMDQVIVKAFMSLVGQFPVGTLVVLDTFELAVVHAANPLPEAVSRPTVRIVSDAMGNLLFPGHLADLSEVDPETRAFRRTIIKVADPDRYGIRVSDYFV